MEKKDKRLVFCVAVIVFACSFLFQFDYRDIASEGMTLSSIVLAVYVAAMMGLIGSNLGEKLAELPSSNPEYTQLWVLRTYFHNAIFVAVFTIVLSSIVLLMPEISNEMSTHFILGYHLFSALSLAIYAVNLVFMGFVLKFMLNRQIWNT